MGPMTVLHLLYVQYVQSYTNLASMPSICFLITATSDSSVSLHSEVLKQSHYHTTHCHYVLLFTVNSVCMYEISYTKVVHQLE